MDKDKSVRAESVQPQTDTAKMRDCRDIQTVPFCTERRGKGICPYFAWSGDNCDVPNTCRYLGRSELDKKNYAIDVDGKGVSHVMLRTCSRPGESPTLDNRYSKANRIMAYFNRLTEMGQAEAVEQVGLLTEIPRFRRPPEPETQPAPLTVRLPLKKEDK